MRNPQTSKNTAWQRNKSLASGVGKYSGFVRPAIYIHDLMRT